MKVTLKKASALAAAATAIVPTIKFDHSYVVDVYGDPPSDEAIEAANVLLNNQLTNALAIVGIVFRIRQMIGQANTGRIDGLLTARAAIDKQLSVLNQIPVRQQRTNLVALTRQMEALKGNEQKLYGNNLKLDLETFSLVSPLSRQLIKDKRAIDEELATLNFTTTIELPADVVKVLTDLDLI